MIALRYNEVQPLSAVSAKLVTQLTFSKSEINATEALGQSAAQSDENCCVDIGHRKSPVSYFGVISTEVY